MNNDKGNDFNLNNPPIIEWWIRSTFIPPNDGEAWDWSMCFDFLERYKETLPLIEKLPSFVPQSKPLKDPKSKNYMFEFSAEPAFFRRRTEDRSKTVQVGEHELVVSHLRKGTDSYPGYSDLFEQFQQYLNDYRGTFHPPGIDTLELHNVDLVVIPDKADSEFELTDFLIGAPSLPSKPFGIAFDTDWTIAFKCPNERDVANVSFTMLPSDENDLRFRLDWHYWCQKIEEDNPDSVADRLFIAHNYLNSCFREIFTPFVWNLFEPQ